jgi:hypothetical protein
MQRRNDLCALANSRRNPLDGFRADISNGEDAPPVGFQRMAIVAGIFAGQHKPLSIECDARAGKPIRIRLGADEQKQVANRPPARLMEIAINVQCTHYEIKCRYTNHGGAKKDLRRMSWIF